MTGPPCPDCGAGDPWRPHGRTGALRCVVCGSSPLAPVGDVVPRAIAVVGDTIAAGVGLGARTIHLCEVLELRGAHSWVRTDCGREGLSVYVPDRRGERCRSCHPGATP